MARGTPATGARAWPAPRPFELSCRDVLRLMPLLASALLRRIAVGVALAGLLSGCAAVRDAPRLAYRCPNGLGFEVRLYEDQALVEGERGHVVLERLPDTATSDLLYADPTLTADFGLGADQRLVRLTYTNIPEPVYCERVVAPGSAAVPVRAAPRLGPRNPPPFDPDAPVETNIRSGDGDVGPG